MPANFTIPLVTVIPGQTITASGWNGEFENIDTNFTPSGLDDYSATDSQMQTATDPYPASATSRPTSTSGEIERIRYVLAQLSGKTYWYQDPDVDIGTFKTRFDTHTHDGTTNNGPQILAGGIASDAVTTAKILDSNVTSAKVADSAITTAKLNDGSVTTAKLDSSLAIGTLNVTTSLSWAGFTQLKILQVVKSTTTTESTTSGTTFANTNLAASITPKLSTSKIFVIANGTVRMPTGDTGYLTIARGSTNLAANNQGFMTAAGNSDPYACLIAYDSPSTTSSTTYNLQMRVSGGTSTIRFPYNNGGLGSSEATMILIEIAL